MMSTPHSDTRENLLAADPEFRRLVEEHTRYAAQLEQIHDSSLLSAEDLLLESELKKMKLWCKDQMEKHAARLANGASRR